MPTWASEHFADHLIGLEFHTETDHKPLLPLLSTRNLEDPPARVQHFRIRMMRLTYSISHLSGKSLYTADTLSRKTLATPLKQEEETLEADVRAYVDSIVKYLSATEDPLEDFRCQQQQDEITRQLTTYCSEGGQKIPSSLVHLKCSYLLIQARGCMWSIGHRRPLPNALCSGLILLLLSSFYIAA